MPWFVQSAANRDFGVRRLPVWLAFQSIVGVDGLIFADSETIPGVPVEWSL
jgi:hypothetical protein